MNGKKICLAALALMMLFAGCKHGKETTYMDKNEFEEVNMFGTGIPNDHFAKYFTGKSYLNILTDPKKSPLFLANVTFEPGCRTNWHIHLAQTGGGQMLICTAGSGWYQQEGKKPVSLREGSFVYIPAGVNHWHGAKKDSWFSHIAIELPGENCKNEWLEAVSDEEYSNLEAKSENTAYDVSLKNSAETYASKKEFKKVNMFGTGIRNFLLAKYFTGRSYLKMLTFPGKAPIFLANVTFEPGARTFWHNHRATKGGGQIIVCTAGSGWYQQEGQEAVSLHEGSVVYIPAGVTHWHGAKKDGWFSHIAIELPGENCKNEWVKAVSDEEYTALPSSL